MVLLVLKTARYVDPIEVVNLGEILVFAGQDFVITVRHGEASDLHGVRERLEGNPELLKSGPGAVVHAIVDKVVDDYQPAIDGLEEDVEQVETEVFSPTRPDRTERIYRLKRETLAFYHAAAPLIAPVNALARGHYDVIPDEVRAYFRDVNDHLLRVHEQLEGLRDLLTAVLAGQPGAGDRAPERGRAQDLGRRRDPGGAHGDRGHLRNELRAHAGARLDVRLSARARADGDDLLLLYRYFRRVGWL